MSSFTLDAAFGTADLSNCERELVHLAGSIQPHGALLVLREPSLEILQVNYNVPALLGRSVDDLLGRPLAEWSPDVDLAIRGLIASEKLASPAPIRLRVPPGSPVAEMEGTVHRTEGQGLVLELELADPPDEHDGSRLEPGTPARLTAAIEEISAAESVAALCDATATAVRDLIGYDRVMVYRFDPEGHGEVVAEARADGLESFLGLHYPASDIPQRARELYLSNRVRALVDVGYTASPLVPRLSPLTGTELDMSLCHLRSMSPIHIQYLKNMGVTATLVGSLIKEGKLWGLIACHHYSPKRAPYEVRTTCDILAQVVSTRLLALEVQQFASSELLVRRLEQQVVESVSATGEWHQALFEALQGLQNSLNATGAALVYQREIASSGIVPRPAELQHLLEWIDEQSPGPLFHSSALCRLEPGFAVFLDEACGVLAARLAPETPDFLLWFRREQRHTVRWAGDPRKPVAEDDPDHLSPRRSFAVWTEMVRGTALPWSEQELTMAGMLQASMADMIQQVHAVRVFIAEQQLTAVRRVVDHSAQPMVIIDAGGSVVLLNRAFRRLAGREADGVEALEDVALCFAESERLPAILERVRAERRSWSGELSLLSGGRAIPVAVRVDMVPWLENAMLGYIILVGDLTVRREAEETRRRLERTLHEMAADRSTWAGDTGQGGLTSLLEAITENARLAAMHGSEHIGETVNTFVLDDIDRLTRRAAELTRQMLTYAARTRRL